MARSIVCADALACNQVDGGRGIDLAMVASLIMRTMTLPLPEPAMTSLRPLALAALFCITPLAALAEMPRTAAPAGAQVYFIEPADGATVGQTFTVKFGLKGMGVAPAGVDMPATGHHHLLVDGTELPAMDMPLPMTDQVRHFGKGQTETELTLPPGQHSLRLLFADKNHVPFDPPVISEPISITVE